LATTHQLVVGAMASGGIFVTLIGLAVVVLAIALIGIYIVRVCTMVVLVAAAPLFLADHALPQTPGALGASRTSVNEATNRFRGHRA
jgi:hypothetical protein